MNADPGQDVSIQVLDVSTNAVRDVPVPVSPSGEAYRLRLKSVTGARTTQVPVRLGPTVAFRLEIPCEGDELILLDLKKDSRRGLLAEAVGKQSLMLPSHDRYAPPPPFRPNEGGALDLCFLVDGTARAIVEEHGAKRLGLLLATRPQWERHVDELGAFAEQMRAAYADLWLSVLAFGDREIEDVEAEDLKPAYTLFPHHISARRLRARSDRQLKAGLMELPPTPGGDFVDALGDALRACEDIGWRASARKVLVVSGDSPGFSILNPAPPYADWHVRQHDVDEAADRLHERGVEIVTVYHRPVDSTLYGIADPSPFLHFAADQYLRLASHPGLAFELESYNSAAAAAICSDRRAIARNSCLGILQDAAGNPATR